MINVFDELPGLVVALPFFLLLILVNWLGFRFKTWQFKKLKAREGDGLGPTEASLLGLSALLLSFTFGMSFTKFENRRQIIVSEANNIGTVILRCDLYSDSVRDLFKKDLKNYVEARIAYYSQSDDEQMNLTSISYSDSISKRCWDRAALLAHNLDNRVATAQMVPALNAIIDIVSTREAARKAVVPKLIMMVLGILVIISAFLSGYGSKKNERNPVLVVAFALMTSLAIYLIIDVDHPRRGLINLDSAEILMVNLRQQF